MTIGNFLLSFLSVLNAMSPYLLLGFLIAGVLHVFVPKRFYAKYLSCDNKLSVLWAALLGIPLPLCSCGVIPTTVGLKNEGASKGAVGMKIFDKFKKHETGNRSRDGGLCRRGYALQPLQARRRAVGGQVERR